MSKNINKLHIIAETACAHDGSIKRLLKMIDDIGRSGSQAIQFRVFDPKNTITINHPHYKKLHKAVKEKKLKLNEVPIVVYCYYHKCNASEILMEHLQEMGFKNVREYKLGIQGWRKRVKKKSLK